MRTRPGIEGRIKVPVDGSVRNAKTGSRVLPCGTLNSRSIEGHVYVHSMHSYSTMDYIVQYTTAGSLYRVVRQGRPLSPLLFKIYIEELVREVVGDNHRGGRG